MRVFRTQFIILSLDFQSHFLHFLIKGFLVAHISTLILRDFLSFSSYSLVFLGYGLALSLSVFELSPHSLDLISAHVPSYLHLIESA